MEEDYKRLILSDERFYDNLLHNMFDDFNYSHKKVLDLEYIDYNSDLTREEFSKLEMNLESLNQTYYKGDLHVNIEPASKEISSRVSISSSPYLLFLYNIGTGKIEVKDEIRDFVNENKHKLIPHEYLNYVEIDFNEDNFVENFVFQLDLLDSLVFELFKDQDVYEKFINFLSLSGIPDQYIALISQARENGNIEEFVSKIRRNFYGEVDTRYMYIPGIIEPGKYISQLNYEGNFYMYYIPNLKLIYYFPYKLEDYELVESLFGEPEFIGELNIDKNNFANLEYFDGLNWKRTRSFYEIKPIENESIIEVLKYEKRL